MTGRGRAGEPGRVDAAAAAAQWAFPAPNDHKYTRGVLAAYVGSASYPGAARLTVAGALGAGIGMVRLIAPGPVTDQVLGAHPEVVTGPSTKVAAVVTGPGMEPGEEARYRIGQAIDLATDADLPLVVDAGALSLVAERASAGPGPARLPRATVLVPHAGEANTLLRATFDTGEAPSATDQPGEAAAVLAGHLGVTVLIKGATTHIATGAGDLLSVDAGTPWLATAGTGDVLAGVIGAHLATTAAAAPSALGSDEVAAAAAAGAFVHGLAGRIAAHAATGTPHATAAVLAATGGDHIAALGGPITATDVANHLPAAVAHLLRVTGPGQAVAH